MKKRILWVTLLITIVAILAFSFISTQVYYNNAVENSKGYLKVYMNAFNEAYYSPNSQNQNEKAQEFSALLNGIRVTIMDENGVVLGESDAKEYELDHSNREEVRLAKQSGEGYAVRHSQTLREEMIYYCKKVDVNGNALLVRIAIKNASLWETFASSLPTLITYLIMDIFACFIFTYAATSYIISPIETLTRRAAYSGELKTDYSELKPIVRVLNDRNANIERQMAQIKEEKELVIKAQKSKDEFIANITHEMNTPLTSVKGYAELLSCGMLNKEQTEVAYKTIASQSERLSNLIACIINYNEIANDELPSYTIDLTKLAKETIAVLQPEARKKGVEIIDKIEEGVSVFSRHERVSEILGNLIRNAIRYNNEGGTVTVELDYNHLSVIDTGIGIAEEDMGKIFSRFYTVDKSHGGKNGGFGLGLAVAKKICDNAGWKIYVKSKLGEGSTFTVNFNR